MIKDSLTPPKASWNAYLIFLLAASFYLYEYVLQVAPGVMADAMMKTFNVSAAGFGLISSAYFYAYAPAQLPAGILFDRYGPRKLMTIAVITCAIGSIFFASTDKLFIAALGRFLIGLASAFSFIGVLVLISRWFPPKRFAFLAGIAQLMSSVGAIFGEAPLAALVDQVGWQNATFILAIIGFLIAALIWAVVRDYPDRSTQSPPKRDFYQEIKRLYSVCSRSYTWLIATYAFTIWTPIAVFAALWGVPYLQQKYQISVIMASSLCTMIWLGIGVGSPLLGWFSDHCKSRRLALFTGALLSLIATILLLYSDLSLTSMYFVLFILGFGTGGQSVSFAVVQDYNPPELVGTASGFNNLSVLLGGAIFQPLVGVILNYAESQIINGVPVYSIESYNKGLIVMPICYFVACIAALTLKKRN